MKKYTMEIILEEGYDEFWEENPDPETVRECLQHTLECNGWCECEVKLKKFEETY